MIPAGIALLLSCLGAFAQGSTDDYQRALGLAQRTENTVFRAAIQPQWIAEGGGRFWYRVATGPDRKEYLFVDPERGTREPLFDPAVLAERLTRASGTAVSTESLKLDSLSVALEDGRRILRFRHGGKRWKATVPELSIAPDASPEARLTPTPTQRIPKRSRTTGEETEIVLVNRTAEDVELYWLDDQGTRRPYGRLRPGAERRQHTFAGHVWLGTDRNGTVLGVFTAQEGEGRAEFTHPPGGSQETTAAAEATETRPGPHDSPDGRWTVEVRDHNLFLRPKAGGEAVRLSRDGIAGDAYHPEVRWSPDSSHLVARRVREVPPRRVSWIEAAPKDQLQPKLHSHDYFKPGDPLPHPRLRVFAVDGFRQHDVDEALYPNPFTENGALDLQWSPDSRECYVDYNQRGHQVYRILAIGRAGEVRTVVEEAPKTMVDWTAKTWRHWLHPRGELLWMSERSGWCHLWRIDIGTGAVKNAVTRGDWVVRSVEHVDAERQQVWVFAGGIRPGQDPYYLHLARVNFDGTGLTVLTEGDGTHKVQFSPDRRWFIDTWSRVDQAPVIELRSAVDGRKVLELERADISRLLAAGWSVPERFSAKGRDGTTDIHGIVIRPSRMDPTSKHPVIEEIYAGPQGAFVPKEFGRLTRQHALAELGFVVVQIDGMGTSQRSKAFHDVAWKNLADAGFPDRKLWMRAAARSRPWMDLGRVGLYGGSAGGQNALRGLLDHGDFYTVAVADCGCHDNRMDKIWWNEQWLGWPVDEAYRRSSNVEDAHKLMGKLLLVVGEVDTNVDPASTMQVSAALVRADKDFELLVMPSTNHGAAETPYASRRRMDFFVRHLLGREPRWH
ncbi:MAG: prolyl oligopeptidase family serine peptidase [Verrucomicrobiota bacterium]